MHQCTRLVQGCDVCVQCNAVGVNKKFPFRFCSTAMHCILFLYCACSIPSYKSVSFHSILAMCFYDEESCAQDTHDGATNREEGMAVSESEDSEVHLTIQRGGDDARCPGSDTTRWG